MTFYAFPTFWQHRLAARTTAVSPGESRVVIHEITVSPHVRSDGHRHPEAQDVYMAGKFICTSGLPASCAARMLLQDGVARLGDTLVVHHIATGVVLRGKVGRLVGFAC
jgi:hypothetical protein